jgi:hypothetical protein
MRLVTVTSARRTRVYIVFGRGRWSVRLRLF